MWDDEDDPKGYVQHVIDTATLDDIEDVMYNWNNPVAPSNSGEVLQITFGWTRTGRHLGVLWKVVNKDNPPLLRVVTAYDTPPKGG